MATKTRLIRLLFERIGREIGIDPHDVEVTITKTPRHNWGHRRFTGHELDLDDKVEV